MTDIRKEWDGAAPSPVDASVYQASDQPLIMWPYDTDISELPVNWAADYSYRLDVFDPANPDSPIFSAVGTNNGADGSTSFDIPRATRMTWTWATQKHDVSEIVGGEVIDVPIAGTFTLLRRGQV